MADDWGSVDSGYGEKTYLKDIVEILDKKEMKKFSGYRPIGPIYTMRSYWITLYKDGKPMPGKKGKPMQIPFAVTNFDSETQKYDESKTCPFAELAAKMNKHLGEKEQCYESISVLTNVIDRKAQENLPGKIKPPSSKEEKTGFRDIDSKHINPVKVMVFSSNEFRKVKGTIELNTVKLKSGETTRGPNDPKFGYDIMMKYVEEEKVASDKLKINKGDRTPLEDEEKEYLLWDILGAIKTQILSEKDAKREADRLYKEFEKSLKSKGKKNDEDEDDDEPEDLDDDDDKPVKKKSKKSVDDDDDEDEKPAKKKKKVDDDDDEDDDDKPVKKKSKKRDDDDDEDEDDKPVKKKKFKKKDDEYEDEDDDDESLNLEDDD